MLVFVMPDATEPAGTQPKLHKMGLHDDQTDLGADLKNRRPTRQRIDQCCPKDNLT